MEVDEIQKQVSKFQRIGCNSLNPNKIATQKGNKQFPGEDSGAGERFCGWPASRIVRVSRASAGKDRHSKVLTSKGLRDRRVRLSITTAIQFYDLQDRLGFDQPSKAVDWLIKAAANSIDELPSLDPSFSGGGDHNHHRKQVSDENKFTGNGTEIENPNYQNTLNVPVSKYSACSSTSEVSKGSDISLFLSENRIRARERARELSAKKGVNSEIQNSSFTDLLTGRINNNSTPVDITNSRIHFTTPFNYFLRNPQMPHFNITAGHNRQFSLFQENYAPVLTAGGGGLGPGINRGTLQSNLFQRFQPALMVDGSTSTNFPFILAPATGVEAHDNIPAARYHEKETSKN